MLTKEDYMTIKGMAKAGMYKQDIAEALEISPKTVSRALKRGGEPEGKQRMRGSILDPYKRKIDELLKAGVWNGAVILREIQAAGYTGQRTLVRSYIQPKRVLRAGRVTVRYETEPGQQLQSDWGEIVTVIAGQETEVKFIANTLGYSRRFHFWCTDSLDAEHTYEGLINSFEYFGGVTEEVLVDNQKTAVYAHPSDGKVIFQERFVDLAGHYGFTPRACRPYRARTKGKDERMVGYIKHHFFARYRIFESWAHLNQMAVQWLREEADPRVHGTVNEVESERFGREQPHLHPLPRERYDTSYVDRRIAGWDSYIEVQGNRYSVPSQWAGQALTIRIGLDGLLRVYAGENKVAEHQLRDKTLGWVTVAEHHSTLWQNTLRREGVPTDVERRSLRVYEEAAQWN
jgi:transposase